MFNLLLSFPSYFSKSPDPIDSTTSIEVSDLTLESLPPEIIVGLMHCLDDFDDLQRLITASVVCYHLFMVYKSSILNRVAQNIIGMDAWKAATIVLVYQRKINRTATKNLPDFAAAEFVLRDEDIRNITTNQRLFKNCAIEFAKLVLENCPRVSASPRDQPQLEPTSSPIGTATYTSSDYLTSSFTADSVLTTKFFYEMLLLGLQYGNDSINMFAARTPLTPCQVLDFGILGHVIRLCPGHESFIENSLWERLSVEPRGSISNRIWSYMDRWEEFSGRNHLLWVKAVHHADYAIFLDGGVNMHVSEYEVRMEVFLVDYLRIEIRDLVKKYKLDCGWNEEA